ncbi:MAG: cytochrome c oxidase subunit II transmembrane domain-containing protein [Crocinitomicaceae bacterium]|nr:cytochrome c oxidase subunit II transmembrane domain-containing protein [Crocinitomicaceae bacterium]MDG1775825.1 cytochrome c oxidase subunit II transmembrane domain-containing protein [Crocinitomicaceae bacterium]
MVEKLVIIAVIILGVIAIAQLMRVYEISSKLRKNNEAEISTRDNRLNANMMLLFMFGLFGGFIWLMLTYGWTGRGEAASIHGAEIDWLLNLNFIIIISVFFITNTLLFFFAFKYVKKPGVKAFFYPHNNKLEMLWTITPAVVLAVIIILGLKTWNEATADAKAESIRVELFSKQFDWTARYSGVDNTLGKFDYKLTTDNNELAILTTNTIDTAIQNMESGISGIKALESKLNDTHLMLAPADRNAMVKDLNRKNKLVRLLYQMKGRHDSKLDAQAWDDFIQKDTLYLCKGKEYEFNFRSKDVIHSAYFPHFRAQMNTVPGMTTRFKFVPSLSTAEMREKKNDTQFNYALLCNKICGGAHYKMKMMVVVLEEPDYKKWEDSKLTQTFRDKYFASTAVVEEEM